MQLTEYQGKEPRPRGSSIRYCTAVVSVRTYDSLFVLEGLGFARRRISSIRHRRTIAVILRRLFPSLASATGAAAAAAAAVAAAEEEEIEELPSTARTVVPFL